MAASDALIVVRPNTAFRLYLPMGKNDGTLVEVAWSSPTITVNKDAATSSIADSPHQIGTTAWGYVDFTAVEIGTSKVITGYWKVTNTDAVPTPFELIVVADSEIPVNVKAISDGLLTAAKFASDFFTGVAQGVWAYATASATVVGSIGKALVAAFAKINLIGTAAASLPPPPSAETITLYLGTVYADADGTAHPISSDSTVDYTGATARLEFGGHELGVVVSGTSGAWVFGIEMDAVDQANLVAGEYSYTLVPRLSGKTYDSPPESAGKLVLVGDH